VGVYEVTQEQYQRVMGSNPSNFKGANLPVEEVSWNDAQEFCRKLSQQEGKAYRLPTEAEWEYACRAGSGTRFHFGDDESQLGEYAWYENNSESQTHPVGTKRPNAFGLFDMHGSVWEWCSDGYDESYYKNSPVDDPQGPSAGDVRVLRGGSWYGWPGDSRSALRLRGTPDGRISSVGFRVARTE